MKNENSYALSYSQSYAVEQRVIRKGYQLLCCHGADRYLSLGSISKLPVLRHLLFGYEPQGCKYESQA